MEQVNKSYDRQTLMPLNVLYDYEHRLDERDVLKVNQTVEAIRMMRSDSVPRPGDLLIFTSRHGDFIPNALIECYDNYGLKIIPNPCIPFAVKTNIGAYCVAHGENAIHVPAGELKLIGKQNNLFKIYGHEGEYSNSFVHFSAEVNLWEYREADPLYGDFSTKDWRKIYLRKNTEQGKGSMYSGEGLEFPNEDSFKQFVRFYQGTVFPGNKPNQIVLWCYKDVMKKISKEEWEKVNAAVHSRRIGATMETVKVVKDSVNHQIVTLIASSN